MSAMKTMVRAACVVAMALGVIGCGKSERSKNQINIKGSDTMVNLAQDWAEQYRKVKPDVVVAVSGGGSGVGIASLMQGKIDMATSSRAMKEEEKAMTKEKTGKEPIQHILGLDALAVYIHKDVPLDTISIEDLAGVYGENGQILNWSQLGTKNELCSTDKIVVIGRQNSSGTYEFFREAVLGKDGKFKLGSVDQSGSKDVVALIEKTPCAIGYSGMGYKTPGVKWLKIAQKKGEAGVAPSVKSAATGDYPIARPLYIYTLGEPTGALKEFLDWCKGPEGQKRVEAQGYVPTTAADAE